MVELRNISTRSNPQFAPLLLSACWREQPEAWCGSQVISRSALLCRRFRKTPREKFRGAPIANYFLFICSLFFNLTRMAVTWAQLTGSQTALSCDREEQTRRRRRRSTTAKRIIFQAVSTGMSCVTIPSELLLWRKRLRGRVLIWSTGLFPSSVEKNDPNLN